MFACGDAPSAIATSKTKTHEAPWLDAPPWKDAPWLDAPSFRAPPLRAQLENRSLGLERDHAAASLSLLVLLPKIHH